MNEQRILLDRNGNVVNIGDVVRWEQESGDRLLILQGKVLSIKDSIRVETPTGDFIDLLWPYDLPDAQIEKVQPETAN